MVPEKYIVLYKDYKRRIPGELDGATKSSRPFYKSNVVSVVHKISEKCG
jgi:hypothetical protein